MTLHVDTLRALRRSPAAFIGALSLLLLLQGQSRAQSSAPVLRIGTSFSLAQGDSGKEARALTLAKYFFKSETGLDNELVPQHNWRELAQKMASKEQPLGIFEGYEFAWAQAENPELKPLALALKGSRYPVACVVVRKDDAAADFAGLAQHTLALPATSRGFPAFFIERQAQAQGKTPEAFFSKITLPEVAEDALDDVVDGNAQATVVDRAALQAYQQRKPGRAGKVKEIVCSEPVLPVIIAYAPGAADAETIQRFRTGLIRASQQERGQMLLALFRLTGFEDVPADFDQKLEATRKAYPVEAAAK